MTKLELSKLIMDYGDFRVEANTLDELRNYETELVNRLYEAINYNRCCTECSDKEEKAFGRGYNLGAKEASDEILSSI